MYKLVIADDERRIREGLKNVVDWRSLGFEIVETFSDGQEVIEYLEYMIPDVILTDIKMINISGVEVAKYVFEKKLPCKVVLISGHQEFQLAVQAIKYEVEDYLLKPTDIEDVKKTFKKIKQNLDNWYKNCETDKAQKLRIAETIPLLEERFFSDLVMGVSNNPQYIQSCMRILYPEIDPAKCKCLLVNVSIQNYDFFIKKVWEYSIDQFEANLKNFLRSYQSKYKFHIVYKSDNVIQLIGLSLEQHKENNENLKDTEIKEVEKLIEKMQIAFSLQANYIISQSFENLFEIKDFAEGKTFWKNEKNKEILYQHLKEQKKLVMSNIVSGNIIISQKIFHNILMEVNDFPTAQRNNIVIDILSTMHMLLLDINKKLAESLAFSINYTTILSFTRQEDLREYTDRIFDRIRLSDGKQTSYDANSLVSKAKAYIKDKVYEDISQEQTAKHLYICPSYLSTIFRKETGENFLKYVTKVKMEKAIELLKDPQYKTYQISEMLGYKTPRYFSKLFFNYTQMNPSEYRKKILHIGDESDEG